MEAHRPGLVRILAAGGLAIMIACFLEGNAWDACAAETKQKAANVSLPDLLANKQRYKGKLIRVRGYIAIGREMESLFAHEEDANSLTSDPKQAIWLNLSMAQHQKYRRYSRTYGVVTGRFKTSDCEGHLCGFGGSLDQVTIRSR